MSEMRTYMRRIGGSKAALPRRCSDRRSSLHCTCMLPPPQLTGSAAANPRSIYSPLALAYLGDAVWEVSMAAQAVGERDFSASMPITVSPAGAAAIAAAAATDASGAAASQLLVLTPAEADVLRWGRNAAVGSIPKSVSAGTYKKATAVEVLVAHLYLTAPQRCAQLIQAAVSAVPLQP
eukprot:XP_001697409.1 predicted protein [Chlamydomonas reinhardtii]